MSEKKIISTSEIQLYNLNSRGPVFESYYRVIDQLLCLFSVWLPLRQKLFILPIHLNIAGYLKNENPLLRDPSLTIYTILFLKTLEIVNRFVFRGLLCNESKMSRTIQLRKFRGFSEQKTNPEDKFCR